MNPLLWPFEPWSAHAILMMALATTTPSGSGTTTAVAPDASIASTPAPSTPADTSGRFVLRTVHVGREPHRFMVWLPPGHTTAQRWPAVVFLHGAGECGDDGERPTRIGLGPRLVRSPRQWPMVVVFPQKPSEYEEWEERESVVLATLERATREFAIDPSRVALAGMSQGGHGTWLIGARQAPRWTCLVPICGYGRPKTIATRVSSLPVWAFHGLKDDVVAPADSRAIVDMIHQERTRLGLAPGDVKLTLYRDANHNSWDDALAEPELPVWILSHRAASAAR